jgi:hypothetical protein
VGERVSTAPDPFSLGGTPDPALPWSHLTKEEWVEFKRTYGDYWALHLGRSAAWVFRRLLYHSNYLTGECFPGHRHLARARKVSTKTIQRATVELLDVGLVDKVIPRGERSGRRDDYPMSHNRRTNLYVVNYVLARTVVAGKLTDLRNDEVPDPRRPKGNHRSSASLPRSLPAGVRRRVAVGAEAPRKSQRARRPREKCKRRAGAVRLTTRCPPSGPSAYC